MMIICYGVGECGVGGQFLFFVCVIEVVGWFYVLGQVLMEKGEIVIGGIISESCKVIENMIVILNEVGYDVVDIVCIGVWLDDLCDFWSFNGVFVEYFGDNLFVCVCVQFSMMVDCWVEVDCVVYCVDRV